MADVAGRDLVSFFSTTAGVEVALGVHPSMAVGARTAGNLVSFPARAIERAVGSSGDDTLAGSGANNRLNGGPGGDDRYLFDDGWGSDLITDGRGQKDAADLSKVAADLTVGLARLVTYWIAHLS